MPTLVHMCGFSLLIVQLVGRDGDLIGKGQIGKGFPAFEAGNDRFVSGPGAYLAVRASVTAFAIRVAPPVFGWTVSGMRSSLPSRAE